MAWESFPISDFDPFFNVKWGHLTTKALYLPYFSYITDPKAAILLILTAAAVALFSSYQ